MARHKGFDIEETRRALRNAKLESLFDPENKKEVKRLTEIVEYFDFGILPEEEKQPN